MDLPLCHCEGSKGTRSNLVVIFSRDTVVPGYLTTVLLLKLGNLRESIWNM